MKITNKNLNRLLILTAIGWIFAGYFFAASEFAVQAAGDTYYVKPDGKDGNDGLSWGTAWATIDYGTQQLQAGDTLLVADGTYNENYIGQNMQNSGTVENRITIKADGDSANIVSTDHAFWIRRAGRDYITIEGFNIVVPEPGVTTSSCVLLTGVDSTGVSIKDNHCTYGGITAGSETGYYYDILIEGNQFDYVGISLDQVRNATVRDNIINLHYQSGKTGISFGYSYDSTFTNNRIYHTVGHGGGIADPVANITFSNNIWYDAHDAVYVWQGQNVTFDHNTIIDGTPAGVQLAAPVEGIFYTNNLVINTWGMHTLAEAAALNSDYNAYYTLGTNDVAYCEGDYDPNGHYDLAEWQALGHDLNSYEDTENNAAAVLTDPNTYDFTPQADSWLCQEGNEGSDGYTIGAINCLDLVPATACGDGEITETCDCGGVEYDSGYCCAGVYQDSDCSTDYIIASHSPEFVIQNADTTSIDLTVTTNYPVTCKYDTNSGTAYADMSNYFIGLDTSHAVTLSGLESSNTYSYYVRCSSSFGEMTSDYEIVYRVLPESEDEYPRLGIVLHGCIVTDEDSVEEAARQDLLVLHKYHTEYGQDCNPDRLSEIRELNPQTKLFVHQPQSYSYLPTETWPGDGSYPTIDHILYDWLDEVVFYGEPEEKWTLTDTEGNTIEELSDTPWTNVVMDITPYCPVKDGTDDYNYNSNNANYTKNTLVSSGAWDGIFWDSLYNNINWMNGSIENPIDIDHDGEADTNDFSSEQWTAGINDFYSKARLYMGEDIWFIGNGNHNQYEYGNGEMIENWWSQRTWRERMEAFSNWNDNGQTPDFNMVVGEYDESQMQVSGDYRVPRTAFAFSLLTGSYYQMRDTEFNYTRFYWLDEYAIDFASGEAVIPTEANNWLGKHYLGEADSDAYELAVSPTIYPQGVWRRNFANGIVLANPNPSSVNIDLGTEYRKISGSQDSSFNDGSTVTSITLTGNNGIVLLDQLCDEDWSCTEWSECENSQQTRTCTDSNACGTEIDKPEETRSCDSTSPGKVTNLQTD